MIFICTFDPFDEDRYLYSFRNVCRETGAELGDEAYKQIMGIIGDPSTAGFGNKTLTEVIVEIQRSISGTASDKEVDDMLNDAFASSDPGGSTPDNTASDKEVDDLLNDVFGEQP